MKFITRVCRVLSLLSAALLVVLSGCGDGNPVGGGGGGIVGDWLLVSVTTTSGGTVSTVYYDNSCPDICVDYDPYTVHTSNVRTVASYKSSGEGSSSSFMKTDGRWTQYASITFTYKVSNGKITTTSKTQIINGVEQSIDIVSTSKYKISNGTLTAESLTQNGSSVTGTSTYTKINLSDYKRSLGL